MRGEGTSRSTATVLHRFDELIEEGERLKESCRKLYFAGSKKSIDPEEFEAWKTNCLSLLKSTFGSSSPHFDAFVNRKFFDYYNSTQIYLGILKGAKEDLRKGYFFHKDLMLSVNIFDSLLNRARRQLQDGDGGEARGILKAVLAEILGKICENKNVPYGSEDTPGSLILQLGRADVLPSEVQGTLEKLQGDFNDPRSGKDLLAEDLEILLAFLDEYLGSQIIILN
ncbi:MAG: hypothetical protein JW820_03110 [Spirochaetales bacterium]|nr:hypothetical protein [Spirochaetales bacterium]